MAIGKYYVLVRRAVVATAAALVITCAITSVSEASYPGRNGRIAFEMAGDIWAVGSDGHGLRRLFADSAYSPSYSPDGRLIALATSQPAVLTADGAELRLFNRAPFDDPAFSPDGERLLAEGNRSLVSFNAHNGRGTHHFGRPEDETPAVSRWNRIAFTRVYQEADSCFDIPPLSDIYVANGDGSARRRLTTTYGSSDADWSPDGNTIVFVRDPTLSRDDLEERPDVSAADCAKPIAAARSINPYDLPQPELYVADSDGQHMRPLVHNGTAPVWSPDGTKIAFVRDDSIWVVNSNGSRARRLVKSGDNPTWQPLPR